ncbi:aminotransferase class V-fold PLP-dependent enzyme [Opacimonas viscosa]|uniref:cysteine desulfurase n=1 Tax=Opacimonas viscosa TaxID=2961944 RepID=A0AA41X0F2_9ALTE|nr:aminotransferase class V-fold PLP-dependent enzyme [Opacimonas viscosa]MCP3427607.1 aminotransferase class V-fold PLP-dependent enzyme [Opacimonas viscosa]
MTMIRDDFPFFHAKNDIVYLDNAATTHKPQCVIDSVMTSLVSDNTNVHRSSYGLASRVTDKFEDARMTLADFLHADDPQSIIWTKGATDSINLLALSLQQNPSMLVGTEILLLESEHHANLLPWQRLAQQLGLRVTYHGIDKNGDIDFFALSEKISEDTALVAFAHVSNALGVVFPAAEICAKARQCKALTVVDGTQALAHFPVSVTRLGCDMYVASGHKMFAPMGIGFCYVAPNILSELPPVQLGGEMVQQVTLAHSTWQTGALKFEAGTPNVPGVLALAKAVEYIAEHRSEIEHQESLLYQYTLGEFRKRPEVRLLSTHSEPKSHVPVFSFTVQDIDAYDLLRILDEVKIALRVGHHCAMPLNQALGITGSCRISLCAYNTLSEVEYFFTHLDRALALLGSPAVEFHPIPMPESQEAAQYKNTGQSSKATQTPAAPQGNSFVNEHFHLPLESKFAPGLSYEQVLRLLMLASKDCPLLDDSLRTAQHHVAGCEVDVWLAQDPQTSFWQGYASSKIVRGLLAILLEKANHDLATGVSSQQAPPCDLTTYLHNLGILRQLSQSRVEGLHHVIARLSA